MIKGKTVVELAAMLAAGAVTEDLIKDELGDGILNSVLSIAGGTIAGAVVGGALKSFDRHTGIVSDLGSVVDDVFSIFD